MSSLIAECAIHYPSLYARISTKDQTQLTKKKVYEFIRLSIASEMKENLTGKCFNSESYFSFIPTIYNSFFAMHIHWIIFLQLTKSEISG